MFKSYKLTTRKQREFSKQKADFKELATEREQCQFLVDCEWFPMEFIQFKKDATLAWYPTAVGMPFMQDAWPNGFATAEEAELKGCELRGEIEQQLLALVPQPI